jgi:hypothetical protein
MKGILTPEQRRSCSPRTGDARAAPLVFTQNWESFLGKLSVPVTEELLAAGEVCRLYLSCQPSASRPAL